MNEILMSCLGLGLFLFGINLMSDALRKVMGEKIKLVINKAVSNPFIAILIGFVVTTIIQSSSGTSAIVIALVTAGLLPLSSAAYILLGANIGSPTTSIILSLNITKYSPFIILIGAILIFFFQNHKKVRRIGRVIIGLGLMFYGLECLSTSLSSLEETSFFTSLLSVINKAPILSLLIGLVLTTLIQSSGATIGILQEMYNLSMSTMSLKAVIAFVLGANIGTLITGVIASLKGSKDSKRLVIFNYMFNIFITISFMCLLTPYSMLMDIIKDNIFPTNGSAVVSVIAVSVNVIGVLIFAWLTPLALKLTKKIIKVDDNEKLVNVEIKLDNNLIKTSPSLALTSVYEQILKMKDLVKTIYDNAIKYMFEKNDKYKDTVLSLEDVVDNFYESLHDYLTKIPSYQIDNEQSSKIKTLYLDSVKDLERISDHCTNLIERMDERYDNKLSFNESSINNLKEMISVVDKMINETLMAISNNDANVAKNALTYEPIIDENEKNYRHLFLEQNMDNKNSKDDLNIVEILSNFERIGDHLTNINEHIINCY